MSAVHIAAAAKTQAGLARRRSLPVGVGLIVGAGLSLGLWGLIATAAARLLAG